jgi:hypothetical protein
MSSFSIGKTIVLLKKLAEIRVESMNGCESNSVDSCDNPGFMGNFAIFI